MEIEMKMKMKMEWRKEALELIPPAADGRPCWVERKATTKRKMEEKMAAPMPRPPVPAPA